VSWVIGVDAADSGTGGFSAPVAPAAVVEDQSGIDGSDADGHHGRMIHSLDSQLLYFVENEGGALAAPVIAATVAGPGIAAGAPPLPDR
jgi:hypothetical protein